jgi:hypothetical protein
MFITEQQQRPYTPRAAAAARNTMENRNLSGSYQQKTPITLCVLTDQTQIISCHGYIILPA